MECHEVYMTFSKLKHGRAGFPMCMSPLACGGGEPMKTSKETEDTVPDEEKKGQIIWCLICLGRANKKETHAEDLCATGRHTPSKRYCIRLKLVMI